MLKQKKLALAVTVAMGAAAVAVTPALSGAVTDASGLFFPHVAGSTTVASIVTVMNVNTGSALRTNGDLHLRLWSKEYTDLYSGADLIKAKDRACTESDVIVTTSYNDIATFDVFGEFGQANVPQGLLFETPTNTSNVKNLGDPSWSVGGLLTKPQRGFLLVDNSDATATGATLYGEAFIFEFGSGATWGYPAYSRNVDTIPTEAFNFSDAGLEPGDTYPVAIMPYDEFETALLVTPRDKTDQARGDLTVGFSLRKGSANSDRGFYDRDETARSTGLQQTVKCVGRVNPVDVFFTNGKYTGYEDGGWTNLHVEWVGTATATGSSDGGAIFYKLEYNKGDSFDGEPTDGGFNNAIELREENILPPPA